MKQQKKKEFWMGMGLFFILAVLISIGYVVESISMKKETTLEEDFMKFMQETKSYSFNTETKFTDEELVKIVKYEYILNIFHVEERDIDVANLIIFTESEIYENDELISLHEETYTYNISELGEVIKDEELYVDEEAFIENYIIIDFTVDTWVGYDEKMDSRSSYIGLGLKKVENNEHVAFIYLYEFNRQMIYGEEVENIDKAASIFYYELDKEGRLKFGNLEELFNQGESV